MEAPEQVVGQRVGLGDVPELRPFPQVFVVTGLDQREALVEVVAERGDEDGLS